MPAQVAPERILCDTSFVSHARARRAKPERFEHWDQSAVDRIESAILAISVVTLAEARFGFLNANWGERRIADEEHRLGSFLHVPLDTQDLDEWARLRDQAKSHGFQMSDNDLWIASTASTRQFPLATSDQDQSRLQEFLEIDVIYMSPEP